MAEVGGLFARIGIFFYVARKKCTGNRQKDIIRIMVDKKDAE